MMLRGMVVMLALVAAAAAQQTETPASPERPDVSQQPGASPQQPGVSPQQQPGASPQQPGVSPQQQPGASPQEPGTAPPSGAMQQRRSQHVDQKMVQMLLLANQGEIAVSQFAQEKASNAAVKDFAQGMVREHSEMVEKLQQVSFSSQTEQSQASGQRMETRGQRSETRQGTESRQSTGAGQSATTGQEAQSGQSAGAGQGVATGQRAETGQDAAKGQRAETGQSVAKGQRAGSEQRSAAGRTEIAGKTVGQQHESHSHSQAGRMADPMLPILQEAEQKCIELTQQELERHQGAEFDKCYMGQQIVAHVSTLAKLQAFQGHASETLQPVIAEAAQTTEKHLEHARAIIKELDTQAASTAQRSGEQTRQ